MCRAGVLLLVAWPGLVYCQQPSTASPNQPGQVASSSNQPAPAESKRLLGIVPNYRTSASLQNYEPLSVKGKFAIASQDALDRGTVVLAAIFAGEAQLTKAEPSFGQGAAGYGRYFGTSYADYFIGDYMTEGVLPTLLHQDPRYFRKGSGRGISRLGYSMGQIFWTHKDSGGTQFNYSEVLGNSIAVAIGQSYYPDDRDAGDAISKLGTQLAVDMASNVLKEFWPEISHALARKHNANHQ